MRLFAALIPPLDVLAALDRAVAAVRDVSEPARSGIAPADRRCRWTPVDDMHVTLAFYGEVPAAAVNDLSAALELVASAAPSLSLSIRGVGTFGRRVLWAGVDGDREALYDLAAACADAGRGAGLRLETRAYQPHLTLAHARSTGGVPVDVGDLAHFASQPWRADSMQLVRSTPGATPRYAAVHRAVFRGPAS